MKPKKPGRPVGRDPSKLNAHVQFRIAPELAAQIDSARGTTPAAQWHREAAQIRLAMSEKQAAKILAGKGKR